MTADDTNNTKRVARIALVAATAAIAAGYAAAFSRAGTPAWAPWSVACGIAVSLAGIIVLGAARGRGGIGRLAIPFAFVFLTLIVGFGLLLGLPANESAASDLWLGLPLRAAIAIYGIGLLPAVVLPIAYALTFSAQTLSAEDVERVKEMAASKR
jgi:hypothetical protein